MSDISWETAEHHHGNWGADRFRRPNGPIWRPSDPAASYMVQFMAGSTNVNQLGYTANPSDDNLREYARYHHALVITVKRYVGYPVYWEEDRVLSLDITEWL